MVVSWPQQQLQLLQLGLASASLHAARSSVPRPLIKTTLWSPNAGIAAAESAINPTHLINISPVKWVTENTSSRLLIKRMSKLFGTLTNQSGVTAMKKKAFKFAGGFARNALICRAQFSWHHDALIHFCF